VPEKATPLYLVYPGEALDGLVYRIVERCPPAANDFRSYEALGKPYDRRDFFKGTGVSMHTSKTRSARIARTYGVGAAIAALDVRHLSVVWARTGGRDHITVWAPAEVLLGCVVQCESYE
jgi:hypothetical protein